MIFDTVIAGGKVVLEDRVAEVDVAIAGERIAAIVDRGTAVEARGKVDATGMIVVPGGIDPHVHCSNFVQHLGAGTDLEICDTFQDCTVSGAYGGITTIIPFLSGQRRPDIIDVFQGFIELGNRTGVTDFAMHSGLVPDEDIIRKQVPQTFQLGINSFKMQMAYRKSGRLVPDDMQFAAMQLIAEGGGVACVHCENGSVIDSLEADRVAKHEVSADYYLGTRLNCLEEEAVGRAITIARVAGCTLYVVHLTSREGARVIRDARARGLDVFTESCPQYLALTNTELLAKGQVHLAKVAPPIREAPDREALWLGLIDGTIGAMGSDHAPYVRKDKEAYAANIFNVPFGIAAIEPMLPFMFSEGVMKGRLSLLQFAKIMSENTARLFGLYPKKGVIKVGSDADLVLIDPSVEWKIKAENQHTNCDYTLFEDWPIQGKPVMSFLRGHTLLKDGELQQQPGFGKFISRPI